MGITYVLVWRYSFKTHLHVFLLGFSDSFTDLGTTCMLISRFRIAEPLIVSMQTLTLV